jgi:hypothetical protein
MWRSLSCSRLPEHTVDFTAEKKKTTTFLNISDDILAGLEELHKPMVYSLLKRRGQITFSTLKNSQNPPHG